MLRIFKVQLPIVSSDPEPKASVYDKGHKHEGQVPVDGGLLTIMRGESKQFFYGKVEKDGSVTIVNVAPWQEW